MYFMIFKDNRSMTGLLPWDKTNFERIIKQKTSVITSLPEQFSSVFTVSESIKIYPTTLNPLPHNPLYEQLSGPFYSFSDKEAIGTYTVVKRPLETTKNDLKANVAKDRYNWEVSGFEMTLQDRVVKIPTDRESRGLFFYAQQLQAEGKTWKFNNNTWLTLSLEELNTIVSAIFTHVQKCFEWEKEISDALDVCKSQEDLKSVDTRSPIHKERLRTRPV